MDLVCAAGDPDSWRLILQAQIIAVGEFEDPLWAMISAMCIVKEPPADGPVCLEHVQREG